MSKFIIPDIGMIRRVLVVKEDVLGSMQNSLYIELGDGTYASVDKAHDISAFLNSTVTVFPWRVYYSADA